jgi:hypothetical protein
MEAGATNYIWSVEVRVGWPGGRMLTGILVVAAAGVCALLASCFMWWATKRSALWAMGAGVLLLVVVIAGAIVIAWLYTRAAYGQ